MELTTVAWLTNAIFEPDDEMNAFGGKGAIGERLNGCTQDLE